MTTWLRHHVEHVGVCRFYMRVEDTPDLVHLFNQPLWRDIVEAQFDDRNLVRDNGSFQTARQTEHVNFAISRARAAGFSHLLFLDDDELLYAPNGRRALWEHIAGLPANVCEAHALTVEALVPSAACEDPFSEAGVFRHRPSEYGSYGADALVGSTGKSIAVLSHEGLCCDGPHHFQLVGPTGGRVGASGRPRADSAVLPPSLAVCCHYESCTLWRWRLKFTEAAWHERRERASRERQMREHIASNYAEEPEAQETLAMLRRAFRLDDEGDGARGEGDRRGPQPPQPPQPQGFKQRFYAYSTAACLKIAEAEEGGDGRALEAAVAEARRLWELWKLAPVELPLLSPGEPPHVLRDRGVTLIAPLGMALKPLAAPTTPPAPGAEELAAFVSAAGLSADVAAQLLLAASSAPSQSPAPASRVVQALCDPAQFDALTRAAKLRVGQRFKLANALSRAARQPAPLR